MREITLINGGVTRIDDADYETASQLQWRANGRYRDGARIGVSSVVSGSAKNGLKLLHRIITGAPPGRVVDHVDGDPLNNTRGNLRVCSHAENMRNRAMNYRCGAGRKGVYEVREAGKTLSTGRAFKLEMSESTWAGSIL